MRRGYSVRPRRSLRYGTLALAALACVAFIALGNWQSRRADTKRALARELEQAARAAPIELPAAPVDAVPLFHRHVAASGVFVPERTVLLANRMRQARAGFEVVTPLKLGDSTWHVLVDRGWIAAPATAGAAPQVRTPSGVQHVDGIALERLPRALETGASPVGNVRQNLDITAYAAETGLALQPLVLEQHSPSDDGLARDWPRADLGIEKNESYALQWYTFAALAVVLAALFSFRRAPHA
ncbi:MAG TPA: SURF1 family protein [Burkholderiales bacterium]|nr:SURF1 family protein [Burkholderiales bacterium]